MADFRNMKYALGLAALLAAFTVPASAQGLNCQALSATQQVMRSEGFAELTGDIILNCAATGVVAGANNTPAGQTVPTATIRVRIPGTTITSRTTNSTGGWSEALLMIDEPSSANQLLCNGTNNLCPVTSDGNSSNTYNSLGGASVAGRVAATKANIFQGKFDGVDSIVFPGVPLDPPASNLNRVIRITNIRVDATVYTPDAGVGPVGFLTFENSGSVSLQNPQILMGVVRTGMGATTVVKNFNYLQCVAETGTKIQNVKITEGFQSAWKPRNANVYAQNGSAPTTVNYTGGTAWTATNSDQNIPATRLFTEDGFVNTLWTSATNGADKIGVSDYGTRVAVSVSAPPAGATLRFPTVVYLVPVGTSAFNAAGTSIVTGVPTGVMRLTTTTGSGIGAYSAVTPITGTNSVAITAATTLVYEVLYSHPSLIETADFDFQATTNNLNDGIHLNYGGLTSTSTSTNPGPVTGLAIPTSIGVGTFAPFYTAVGTDVLGIPRFRQTVGANADLLQVSKCSCNLLFPWVVSDTSFETGIVIANTGKDPGTSFGFTATGQTGKVTFFYFGTAGVNSTTVSTAANNVSLAAGVAPGNYITHVLGADTSAVNGLTARPNFAGYVIAQSEFQYCHGIAQISNRGTGGQTSVASYLGLVLDADGDATQLTRTNQAFFDALNQ